MSVIEYQNARSVTSIATFVGFTECYQEAFGGPPYFEKYGISQIHDYIWTPHLKEGLMVLAFDAEAVIGFGCGLPFLSAPDDAQRFLRRQESEKALRINLEKAWYISEVGVAKNYRRRKIGYMLTKETLEEILRNGATHYVVRTAAQGSNSLHMYEKIGSTILSGFQDVSESEQVQVNESQSSERVYFFGSCSEALSRISTIVGA